MNIPRSHPRYASLLVRERIEEGVRRGITSLGGLIAQGRGEAWDYLLGEKTQPFAKRAIEASAALLLLAKRPVICVNGNAAALCPKELVQLANILGCPLEVNVFHASKKREKAIAIHLKKHGAREVLLPQKSCTLKFLESNRKFVNPEGIYAADAVFVPLEDGDRAQALIRNGKKVVTIDLNPLSRTAKSATITIVDNIVRALPLLVREILSLKKKNKSHLEKILKKYDNGKILRQATSNVRSG